MQNRRLLSLMMASLLSVSPLIFADDNMKASKTGFKSLEQVGLWEFAT